MRATSITCVLIAAIGAERLACANAASDQDIFAIVAPGPDQPLAGCVVALRAWSRPSVSAAPPDDIVEHCAGLPDEIARTLAHRAPRSAKRVIEDPSVLLREGQVLRALMDRHLGRNEVMRASQIAIDFFRLVHELRRGEGADLAFAMVGVAAVAVYQAAAGWNMYASAIVSPQCPNLLPASG